MAFAAVSAGAVLQPSAVNAQSQQWDSDRAAFYGPSAPKQSFLDRKVKETLERASRFLTRAKKEHFAAYLSTFTAALAAVTGLVFGLISYQLSDPMSPYRLVKRRTLLLALAVGASLGVFTAVIQVPDTASSKIALLLISAGTGTVGAFVAALAAFLFMRRRSLRSAQRNGRRITDRMRHA